MTARFSPELLAPRRSSQSSVARAESASESIAHALPPSASCDVLPVLPVGAGTDGIASLAADEDIYVPESYESNYAYPLIVWLVPPEGAELRLHRLMPMISERNYFGVAMPCRDVAEIEERLPLLFGRLRQQYRLHTERVFLAGIGASGTDALVTSLSHPHWFGGIAALSARWPETPQLLRRFSELRGKRVFLGVDSGESASVIADALYAQQLLWSAGMQVSAFASPAGADRLPSLLREIDRWIMQTIEQPEMVC